MISSLSKKKIRFFPRGKPERQLKKKKLKKLGIK
jgi:hypothetical protein